MRFCCVAGTHDGDFDDTGRWWQANSRFVAYLRTLGYDLVCPERPFVWTGDLDGIWKKNGEWATAGNNLFQYLVPALCNDRRIRPADTHVITHSHGINVALFAASYGLKIQTLISVAGPVRKDMMKIAERARPNITRWVQLRSDRSDWWQWFGEIGDGRLGIYRDHPLADVNLEIKGVGHSGLVRDPKHFHYWQDYDFILPKEPA